MTSAMMADVLAGRAAWHIEQCDVRDGLAALPPGSVSLVVTSPPYWRHRQYNAGPGELGSEPEPDCLAWARREPPCPEPSCWVCHLRLVLGGRGRDEGLWRVLRDDGLCVVDVGSCYVGAEIQSEEIWRIAPKNDALLPERLALAMQADGWIVRSAPWYKASPMPESAGDRPATAHERIILASKGPHYYWDADAIRVYGAGNGWHGSSFTSAHDVATKPGLGRGEREERVGRSYRTSDPYRAQIDAEIAATTQRLVELRRVRDGDGLALDEDGMIAALWLASGPSNYDYCAACGTLFEGAARRRIRVERVPNLRHVPLPGLSAMGGLKAGLLVKRHGTCAPFLLITRTCPCGRDDAWVDHFAAFPERLVEPWIQAACPQRCCASCGAGWVRVVSRGAPEGRKTCAGVAGQQVHRVGASHDLSAIPSSTLGWRPSCSCGSGETAPGIVLDPFAGSGTTGLVARRLGRRFLGLELSGDYVQLARARMTAADPDEAQRPVPGIAQAALWGVVR